jgi:hemerythrin-like metal-binding protein
MDQLHIDQNGDRISGALNTSADEHVMPKGAPTIWQEIETEHAAIIEHLNRARTITAQSRLSIREVISSYEAVVRKFEDHFANEERLMGEAGFPDADAYAHHRHHQVLLIRLFSICERMKAQQSVEVDQLHLILQSLLDDAIGADVSLKEHLERNPEQT